MKAFIYPYKVGSESCKALALGLDLKRIAHVGSRFKGSDDRLVINWGASSVSEEVAKCQIVNHPSAVKLASNKLLTFQKLNEGKRTTRLVNVANNNHKLDPGHDIFNDVEDGFTGRFMHPRYGNINILETAPNAAGAGYARTPEFTDSVATANVWRLGGHTVVERHVLNGNSGEGIRLVEAGDDLERAPLYVQYVPKKQEYRVHVCGGEAVDIQRKARRHDIADEDINWKIRNHDNGFIFARNEDGFVPNDVVTQAVNAVRILGLDFGAVDVIFNDKQQKAYVLEVNTAPGLAGATLEGYVRRFTAFISGERKPIGLGKAVPVEAAIPKVGKIKIGNFLPPLERAVLNDDPEYVNGPAW